MSQLVALLSKFIKDNNLSDKDVLDLHASVDWHGSNSESPEEFVQELKDILERNLRKAEPRSRSGKSDVNPFHSAIKTAMRSDPDILLVGEVRDHE